MDVVGEGSQAKRRRINWKKESVVRTFLEACIHEVVIHGREGTNLKPRSWKNVAETLKNKHNFVADQKQMKNHYDYLKAKYNTWTRLKNKTGNVYDPTTNTFNLTDEEWEIEIEVSLYFYQFISFFIWNIYNLIYIIFFKTEKQICRTNQEYGTAFS